MSRLIGRTLEVKDNDGTKLSFLICSELGSGGFGSVYEVVCLDNCLEVNKQANTFALKSIDKHGNGLTLEELDKAKREAQLIMDNNSLYKHKNIITPYKIIPRVTENDIVGLYILMEYINGKTLHDSILDDRTVIENMKIIIKLLDTIQVIHTNGFVHRDIKPQNIVMRKTGNNTTEPVIVDFGLVYTVDRFTGTINVTNVKGSLPYLAPELRDNYYGKISNKVDMYAFGLTVYQILTKDNGFISCANGWHEYIQSNPNILSRIEDYVLREHLIKPLLSVPSARPDCNQLSENPFILGWKELFKYKDSTIDLKHGQPALFYSCFISSLSDYNYSNIDDDKIRICDDLIELIEKQPELIIKFINECDIINHICKALLPTSQIVQKQAHFFALPGDPYNLTDSNDSSNNSDQNTNLTHNNRSLVASLINLLNLHINENTIEIITNQLCSTLNLNILIDIFKKKIPVHKQMIEILNKLIKISYCEKELNKIGLESIIIHFLTQKNDENPKDDLLHLYENLTSYNDSRIDDFFNEIDENDISDIFSLFKNIFKNCVFIDNSILQLNSFRNLVIKILQSFNEISNYDFIEFLIYLQNIILPMNKFHCFENNKNNSAFPLLKSKLKLSSLINENIEYICACNLTTKKLNDFLWQFSVHLPANNIPHNFTFALPKCFPVPQFTRNKEIIFYYEISILKMPKNIAVWRSSNTPMISIGISHRSSNDGIQSTTQSITPFDDRDYAYCSTGSVFENSTEKKNDLPSFGTGDIVGCGITENGNLFFTLNGVFLAKTIKLRRNLNLCYTCVHICGLPTKFNVLYNNFCYDFKDTTNTLIEKLPKGIDFFKNQKIQNHLENCLNTINCDKKIINGFKNIFITHELKSINTLDICSVVPIVPAAQVPPLPPPSPEPPRSTIVFLFVMDGGDMINLTFNIGGSWETLSNDIAFKSGKPVSCLTYHSGGNIIKITNNDDLLRYFSSHPVDDLPPLSIFRG